MPFRLLSTFLGSPTQPSDRYHFKMRPSPFCEAVTSGAISSFSQSAILRSARGLPTPILRNSELIIFTELPNRLENEHLLVTIRIHYPLMQSLNFAPPKIFARGMIPFSYFIVASASATARARRQPEPVSKVA